MRTIHISHYILKSNKRNILGHRTTMVLIPQLPTILCSSFSLLSPILLSSISLSLSLSHTHADIYRQSWSLCLLWSLWSSQPKWSPATRTEISTNQRNQALIHFQHLSFLWKNTSLSHARWNNPLHIQIALPTLLQAFKSISLSLSHTNTHAQLQKDLEISGGPLKVRTKALDWFFDKVSKNLNSLKTYAQFLYSRRPLNLVATADIKYSMWTYFENAQQMLKKVSQVPNLRQDT